MQLHHTTISEDAPAKINLALHVTGQRQDGYHLLDSLVTFCRHGDRLTFAESPQDRFTLSGRFAPLLETGGPNLVVKARDFLRRSARKTGHTTRPVHIHLEKNLPIASGIGGGSADAAATLRGLMTLWALDISQERLDVVALSLGADVPMCLHSAPLIARGIGEDIMPLPGLPSFAMVLGNPLTGVSTPEIFRRLVNKSNPAIPSAHPADGQDWIAHMHGLRNDLEPAARELLPSIAMLSDTLRDAGARLVRMSGSGATCFGLFDTLAGADQAATWLASQRPDWYFQATETIPGGRYEHDRQ